MKNNIEKLNTNLLAQVKQGFVPMPGGQAEPVAGASPMTAGMGAPMGGPPGGMPPGGAPPGGGGEMPVDPNTGMPIDPNTGMPIDPNTGLPIDPGTGLPIDPSMMGGGMPPGAEGMPPEGMPPEGAPAEGTPGEQPEPTVTIAMGELKDLLEVAVKDALQQILPKEIAAAIKTVKVDEPAPAPKEPKQEAAPAAPAPAPAEQPAEQGPDKLDEVLAQLQRNNELMSGLIGVE